MVEDFGERHGWIHVYFRTIKAIIPLPTDFINETDFSAMTIPGHLPRPEDDSDYTDRGRPIRSAQSTEIS